MKKILIYFNSIASAGGIERVIANLVNELCKDYEVSILTKDNRPSFYQIDDLVKRDSLNCPLNLNMKSKIQRIFAIFINFFKIHIYLKRDLSLNQYDFIYVATPLNALEIYILGKDFKKILVISEHASKFACNIIYQKIRKCIYPKVNCLSVPTTQDTKLYLDEGCNAVYIPHLSTFKAIKKNKLDTKIAINIGRLTSDKQQILLLEMWNDLFKADKLDGWQLVLIGKGEEENDLQNYIKKNFMESCASILEPRKNVSEIYKKADLFLFSSIKEGFGMVLLEAMSFGIPCISFDCPSGPKDIIKQGLNGYLVPCFDKIEYKKRIIELIENRQILKNLGDDAFNTIKNWNNADILKQWHKVFNNTR